MSLSDELVSALVKVVKTDDKAKDETTVYGTIKTHGGSKYVQIDGSELLTPISTTADIEDGERVTVMIKNHTATVTGNISSPAARTDDLRKAMLDAENINNKISEFEIAIAYRVTTEDLAAVTATIESLRAKNANLGNLEAVEAEIESLQSKFADLTYVTADEVNTLNAAIENLRVTFGKFADISADELEAVNADIDMLRGYTADFTYVSADVLHAIKASIDDLDVDNLDVRYANIDFSNIGSAAIETFFSTSGLIENVVVGDGTITGNLVGVTIRGDVIEGNTVVADKLVIKGEDGLFYKLNTDGITTEAEQTNENSLDGSVITAKSITATKISVDDLVAFDATIGGFNITDTSIYSEVKDSEDNTTRGIYLDVDGQVNFGDAEKFIKYYRDNNGEYKLVISADTILYDLNGSPHSIADLGAIGEYVKIGTYESEPCIELGESDSDFKLVITNTRIMFMEGNGVPAYINNQSLYINKAVIEKELQQGDFVWQVRANGNLGLVWKGAIE